MKRFRTKVNGKLKYTYLIGFKYIWTGKGSFEEANDWVDQHGDCSYGFLDTVVPIEEFSPDDFEHALETLVADLGIQKNIDIVPTFIQKLKYHEPNDNETNAVQIPVSFLGGDNA